jgi:uncharacterized protein
MSIIINLVAGLIFGVGLIVSGMANPAKVLNFLDLSGTWDPSLALVMGGAVLVTFVGYRLTFLRARPLFDTQFHLPSARTIDRPLVIGSALFGIGWGLGGLCPGPALTALTLAAPGTLAFIPAMVIGIAAARFWQSAATTTSATRTALKTSNSNS